MRFLRFALALVFCLAPLTACDGGAANGTTVAVGAAAAEDDVIVEPGRVFVTIDGAEAWRDPAVRAAGGAQ